MAVISGVVLIKGGWVLGGFGNRASVIKMTLRGTPSSGHIPNKPPHQSQTATEDEANV